MDELIINFAKEVVVDYKILAYVFFFISQALQILFPPYPGDMVLILEGYLTELANLNVVFVMINAIAGTTLASILLYKIGEKEEEKILHARLIKYLFNTKRVSKLRHLFDRFGAMVIVLSKIIPGIFSITVLSAGIFKVRKKVAYISILLITSVHHIILILIGKIVRENWADIFYKINQYNQKIILIGAAGLLIYLGLLRIKNKLLSD